MNTIRMWLTGAIAGVVLILVGWLRVVSNQRDNARTERDIAINNEKVTDKMLKAQEDLADIVHKSRKETDDAKAKTVDERPSGRFGSDRMRS